MSRTHRKVCMAINYIEHLLILASSFTGSVSISAFSSLVGTPIGMMSSTVELKVVQ